MKSLFPCLLLLGLIACGGPASDNKTDTPLSAGIQMVDTTHLAEPPEILTCPQLLDTLIKTSSFDFKKLPLAQCKVVVDEVRDSTVIIKVTHAADGTINPFPVGWIHWHLKTNVFDDVTLGFEEDERKTVTVDMAFVKRMLRSCKFENTQE